MTSILYQLFRPWGYLLIKHESKWIYDYLVPSVLMTLTALPISYFYLYSSMDVFSKQGLVRDMISFLSTLPGFFIAALAAIATFQKNDIDEEMPLPTKMNVRLADGLDIEINLTRRRFLCALFAFLTAHSLFICTAFFILIHIAPAISALIDQDAVSSSAGLAAIWIFFFLFWQLLSSTALGLYYLGDRLHHPKS